MNDEWVETTLGEVAEWGAGGTPKAGEPRYYEGGTIPWAVIGDIQGGRLAATERYITHEGAQVIGHLAPAGSVLVTMYGTIGRVAIAEVEMATNQAIAWGIPDTDQLSSEFLFYWLANHQPVLDSLARGATQRNINRAIVKSQPLRLPPLTVQRRIVDVMEHLDTHIANLQAEIDATSQSLDSWLDHWLECRSASDRVLGDVCDFRSGPSWKADDESPVARDRARRVLKITNTPAGRRLDLSGTTYVRDLPASVRTISERSIVMIRTNGNRERIGNVYLPQSEIYGASVSAFQFLAETPSVEDRDFIYWWLSAPSMQRHMSDAASGTTGLGNLASSWLKRLHFPHADSSERRQLTNVASHLQANADALTHERERIRCLRDATLSSLLSGAHSIPASYDELLGSV